jgi:peptidoglycan glycosyltransferase
LGNRVGGVVVLDAQTGAILADASYPHYDPNGMAFNPNADDWNAENARIVQYWEGLTSDPSTPLVLRATQGRYPPGSTYKTVTLAAGIDMGIVRPDTPFTDTGRLVVEPGAPPDVDCNGCRPARNPPIFSLQEGYQWSLNIVFAQLGLRVGADKLVEYSRRFGYDNAFEDVGIPIAPSRVAVDPNFLQSKKALAGTSYGQGQMQATALQMALVAAGVAHGGAVPAPYIVQKVVNPANNATVLAATPRDLGRAVSPTSAATLQQMMIISVEKGFANPAHINGATVGGKTGTAETGRGTNHAWFIAFAGPDPAHLRYAIAVVLEEGGEGSRVAAPLAKQVLQVALQK